MFLSWFLLVLLFFTCFSQVSSQVWCAGRLGERGGPAQELELALRHLLPGLGRELGRGRAIRDMSSYKVYVYVKALNSMWGYLGGLMWTSNGSEASL